MMATWAPAVFGMLLIPLLIILLIVYLKSKKFYRLVYILSVFTYAMTIMYWIDVYQLKRNPIIGLLLLSSILMIMIGRFMRKEKRKKTNKNLIAAIVCIVIIAILITFSGSNIGWKVEQQAAQSIQLKDVIVERKEGEAQYGPGQGTQIYTITVTNTFIPRLYELPKTAACLYNSELKATTNADIKWAFGKEYTEYDRETTTMEVYGTKTANLLIFRGIRYKPESTAPVPVKEQKPEVYDQLLLFLSDRLNFYMDCYALQEKDFDKAIKIKITQ